MGVYHPSIAPPTCIVYLWQYYCTTIAQYTPPPPTPPFYAIHHTILVMAISCKGQRLFASRRLWRRGANYRLPTSSCSPPRHPIGRPFGIALSSPIFPHLAISISRICQSEHINVFLSRENILRVLPVESYLAVCSVLRDVEAIIAQLLCCIRSSATSAVRLPYHAGCGGGDRPRRCEIDRWKDGCMHGCIYKTREIKKERYETDTTPSVYLRLAGCKNINRSHTHTDREQHPRQRHTHTHTTRTTPQTNTSHKHLATLEGGATTVRATSSRRLWRRGSTAASW